MRNVDRVDRFVTSGGRVLYRLPVVAFPGHVTNCYLLMGDPLTLVDVGSGAEQSNRSLLGAFEDVRRRFHENVRLEDVRRVIITHGHIDHFGGLNFVLERAPAQVGVHPLDRTTLTHFEQRLAVSLKNLQIFLRRAGLAETEVASLIRLNTLFKHMFKATRADFILDDDAGSPAPPFDVFHTPGHCPGHVCLRVEDILLTGDHVLPRITPAQSPAFIFHYNGLGHYVEALRRLKALDGIALALGGHEGEMPDLPGRIDAILAFHDRRLDRVLEACREPRSIAQVARDLFPRVEGYHVLLAMLETGAHVEYLHERGRLAVANVEALEGEPQATLLYRSE